MGNYTFYNLLMSVIWGSIFMLLFCVLRKNYRFIENFGVWPLAMILILAVVRFFVFVELPFTKTITSSVVMVAVQSAVRQPCGLFSLTWARLLIIIWCTVSLLLFIRLLRGLRAQRKKLDSYQCLNNNQAVTVMDELLKEEGLKLRYELVVTPDIRIPSVAGLHKPTFLLPDLEFTQAELKHILRHELYHYTNMDAYIKLFIAVFKAMFWWNLLVYPLDKDLDYVLELRCDSCSTRNYSEIGRIEYVQAVKSVISSAGEVKQQLPNYTSALGGRCHQSELFQRMKIVLSEPQRERKSSVLVVILILSLFLSSYAFVIQPFIDMPDDAGIIDINRSNSYILHTKDGRYELYYNNERFGSCETADLSMQPLCNLEIREG